MFRKENSSCSSTKASSSNNDANANIKKGGKLSKKGGGKNAAASSGKTSNSTLDVPLRKSDIRHLRQRTKDFFSVGIPPAATVDDTKDESTEEQQQQQDTAVLTAILDKVFLPGNIATRQLHHPELGKLTLYVRTPSADIIKTAAAAAAAENDADFFWPYAAPQVIWISQPPMPNTNQVEVAMPTLALLSVLPPRSMPTVYIPSPASKFLCRGAHLMRAGMRNLPAFEGYNNNTNAATTHAELLASKNLPPPRVVAIAVAGNPQPMAVGVLDAGVQYAADIGVGTKGVGATVWTCYGDDLWQQQLLELDKIDMANKPPVIVSPIGGANFNEGHYGNVGFLEAQRVAPIVSSAGSDEDDEEDDSDDNQAETAWDANEPAETKDDTKDSETKTDVAGEKEENHENLTLNDDEGDQQQQQQQQQQGDTTPAEAKEEDPVSQEDILHQAFCQACLTSVSPKDLPMTVANFYANHVLPSRPPGTNIQLKQTRYKKFGNYLMERVEQKMITLGPGPDKSSKDKVGYLMSVDKRHPVLLTYKQDHAEEVQEAKDTRDAATASAKHKLVLVNLYVVPHHFIAPLRLDPDAVKGANASSPDRAGTGMLTLPEVRKLLEDYLERENLVDFDQAQLDGPLFDALYKKKKGGEVTNDTLTVSRKDMADQWISVMDAAYAIVQMPGSKILKLGRGKPPKVQIEVSTRQNRKFITKVRGMESYGVNGQVLAKDIGRRLATQATVETESEKGAALAKGCVEIVLGGNFADEVEALLLGDPKLCPSHGGIKNSDYKLPKNCVDVVLRKGVPARKRTKNKK